MTTATVLPCSYQPVLSTREIEAAIQDIKDFFERRLARALNLKRVAAPLLVRAGTGINDDLNGVERPVRFAVRGDGGAEVEIVQSLAKWKRLALARYGFQPGEGLYTDMNAIRPDETLDNLHSVYVDQWDWERVIEASQRRQDVLEEVVRAIYEAVRQTEYHLASRHPHIRPRLPQAVTLVTAEDLVRRFPGLPPREREDRVAAEAGAVFILGIGDALSDGQPHDGRAPDYDDWTTPRVDGGRGLNGDLLLWHPELQRAIEISSMGIRVAPETLRRQLAIRGLENRAHLPFHRALLEGKLPQTMGGGIGQSRLCMCLLHTAHIGEVSVGIWPREMEESCALANVMLL